MTGSPREEKLFRRRAIYLLTVILTYLFCVLVLGVVLNALMMLAELPPYFILVLYAVMLVSAIPLTEYITREYLAPVYAQVKDN
ncbi:MAG: hypothetical protein IIY52_04600 [Solobacterium sp.]|nr:hypothetical protein [Solobacterium sp.]MBQ1383415.1 hypothetical protein [Solobacterium sp.]MBQ1447531.1 hypothetical protein [Solobacterium sp.]MBR0479424.1 hypothetical protein [Solobacterium sp.]MBR2727440.1 hypothetical protein [Solobacterium sp.]